MGREATVQCRWGEETGLCKVLLETHELILRGDLRRRVPLASLSDVRVEQDRLCFRVGRDEASLRLGSQLAERWAKAITTPPPSLAAKLGISRASHLLLIGSFEDAELKRAIAEANTASADEINLIMASITTGAELDRALKEISAHLPSIPPVWIVYPKGSNGEIGESTVRAKLRGCGFTDTKVASVSPKLTALRFIKRLG